MTFGGPRLDYTPGGPPYQLASTHVVRFFPSENGKGCFYISLSSTPPHLLRSSGSQALIRKTTIFAPSPSSLIGNETEVIWKSSVREYPLQASVGRIGATVNCFHSNKAMCLLHFSLLFLIYACALNPPSYSSSVTAASLAKGQP